MDLSTQFPKSPYDMNAGLVMLPRTMDKCQAHLAGTLGGYYYNCPLDELLFEFLGIDADTFTRAGESSAGGEAEIAEWIESHCARSLAEKDAFNTMMHHLVPRDEEAKQQFAGWQKELGRTDYFTYFDHLDADEGRF